MNFALIVQVDHATIEINSSRYKIVFSSWPVATMWQNERLLRAAHFKGGKIEEKSWKWETLMLEEHTRAILKVSNKNYAQGGRIAREGLFDFLEPNTHILAFWWCVWCYQTSKFQTRLVNQDGEFKFASWKYPKNLESSCLCQCSAPLSLICRVSGSLVRTS